MEPLLRRRGGAVPRHQVRWGVRLVVGRRGVSVASSSGCGWPVAE